MHKRAKVEVLSTTETLSLPVVVHLYYGPTILRFKLSGARPATPENPVETLVLQAVQYSWKKLVADDGGERALLWLSTRDSRNIMIARGYSTPGIPLHEFLYPQNRVVGQPGSSFDKYRPISLGIGGWTILPPNSEHVLRVRIDIDERIRQRCVVKALMLPGSKLDHLAMAVCQATKFIQLSDSLAKLILAVHQNSDLTFAKVPDLPDLFMALSEAYEESGVGEHDLYKAMFAVTEMASLPPGILPLMMGYVGTDNRKRDEWAEVRHRYGTDPETWTRAWNPPKTGWDWGRDRFYSAENSEDNLHPLVILGLWESLPYNDPMYVSRGGLLCRLLSTHITPHPALYKALVILHYLVRTRRFVTDSHNILAICINQFDRPTIMARTEGILAANGITQL